MTARQATVVVHGCAGCPLLDRPASRCAHPDGGPGGLAPIPDEPPGGCPLRDLPVAIRIAERAVTPAQEIGERIRTLRQHQRLRVIDVARASGLTGSNLARIESGRYASGNRGPTLDTLIRIATALDVSVSELVEGL